MNSDAAVCLWLEAADRADRAERELLTAVAGRGTVELGTAFHDSINEVARLRGDANTQLGKVLVAIGATPREIEVRLDRQKDYLTRTAEDAQYFVGMERSYQLAILALIETNSDKDRLGQVLERLFAEDDLSAPHDAQAGEHMKRGIMDGLNLIRMANILEG